MRCKELKPRTCWINLTIFAFLSLLLTLLLTGSILAHDRAMILVHPVRSHPQRNPSDVGLKSWIDVQFPSTDGLQLGAWFIPVESEEPSPILIYVHGLGSNREGLLDQAQLLYAHGYSALLIDLRNHGGSQGEITTLGFHEVMDVEGAVKFLLDQDEIDPDRIGLIGESMGGAVVIRAAARIPIIKAIVAESAYTSLEDNLEQGVRALTGLPPFPFAPLVVWFGERETGADITMVRPIDDLDQIPPRSIMFIHGEQDPIVEVNNSRKLYEAASEPKEILIISNAGHGGLLDKNPELFQSRVVDFLNTYLK
jgi:fermentation-respiration switch protein FrsA (DUF1100 family)